MNPSFSQAPNRTSANLGPAAQDRIFALCVLASIAVHASMLFLFPALRPGETPPSATRMLIARITERVNVPEPPLPVREARRPEPDRPRTAPVPKPEAEPPRPAMAEPPASAPQAAVTPAAPAPQVPAAAAAPVLSSPASQPGAASVRAPEARPPAPTARASAEPDAGSVEQFRRALFEAAKRYDHYPVQARERGWEGRVEIRLVIGPTGIIQSSVVKASSGHGILDNQALDMLKRAKPLAPVPAPLRGREFSVDIPVKFELRSE